MLHNLRDGAISVLLGIFEQFTKLAIGQALPDHRHVGEGRCQSGAPGGVWTPAVL